MKNKVIFVAACGILAANIVSGCVAETAPDLESSDDLAGPSSKSDAWNAANNPGLFGTGLKTKLSELPRSGRAARVAWPSTYWPTYEDSINVRWNGSDELSAAEKYDRAFNGWTPSTDFMKLRPFRSGRTCGENRGDFDENYYSSLGPLARYVSANMGNADSRDGVDSDGDGKVDECDDNDGIQGWWGLCHAWVPAALLEETPTRAVTYNGVTFYPSDLQALLIAAYNRSSAAMIGGRCNEGAPSGNGETEEVERDEQGRAKASNCRDSNAGSLHVILSNFLGIRKQAFAEDRTFNYEVWNQPVVEFEVNELREITEAEAISLLEVQNATKYPYNNQAKRWAYVQSDVTYITESSASETLVDASEYEREDSYEYILELDQNGVILGGEYVGSSKADHPDFLWNPIRLTKSSTPYLNLEQVRRLIQMANAGSGDTSNAITATGQGALTIPDNVPAGVASVATVSSAATVGSLSVDLDIAHTYVGDLKIVLSHGSTERVIWNMTGGSTHNIKQTIPVSGFEGQSAEGTWTLKVVDAAAYDEGTLNSWTLRVTPQ